MILLISNEIERILLSWWERPALLLHWEIFPIGKCRGRGVKSLWWQGAPFRQLLPVSLLASTLYFLFLFLICRCGLKSFEKCDKLCFWYKNGKPFSWTKNVLENDWLRKVLFGIYKALLPDFYNRPHSHEFLPRIIFFIFSCLLSYGLAPKKLKGVYAHFMNVWFFLMLFISSSWTWTPCKLLFPVPSCHPPFMVVYLNLGSRKIQLVHIFQLQDKVHFINCWRDFILFLAFFFSYGYCWSSIC